MAKTWQQAIAGVRLQWGLAALGLLKLALLVWMLGGTSPEPAAQAAEAPTFTRPKLVVVLAIDQFRGDLVTRFADLYSAEGFGRITREGYLFDACYFDTANTETGPGHAAMLTGAYANKTGIALNNWHDAATTATVYCVADPAVKNVGSSGPLTALFSDGEPASPRNLMAETVGDVLKNATGGHARTISISMKDRAAILMGGHGADLALWFDKKRGEFVTSTWYADALPAWVAELNRQRIGDQWFHTTWTLLLNRAEYERRCTADDTVGETHNGAFDTATFPHGMGWGADKPDARYYTQLYTSPFGNDMLVKAAAAAIEHEQLGADATPDLLTLSFSSNDPVGHAFGPASWEVMDTALRTDLALARLMQELDTRVGRGQWSLFITADHGVADLPEVSQTRHHDAERLDGGNMARELEAHLVATFGAPAAGHYVAMLENPWVSLNGMALAAEKGGEAALVKATVAWMNRQPQVAFALPTADILNQPAMNDPQLRGLQNCYYPGRCGQVGFSLRAFHMFAGAEGTTHGSTYRYDQHVALLAYGAGIRAGRSSAPVQPIQIAPTVSALMGINAPATAYAPALAEALAWR